MFIFQENLFAVSSFSYRKVRRTSERKVSLTRDLRRISRNLLFPEMGSGPDTSKFLVYGTSNHDVLSYQQIPTAHGNNMDVVSSSAGIASTSLKPEDSNSIPITA